MNALGRLLLNNRFRVEAQRRWVIPRWERIGGRLDGCRVLEIGCGRGMGLKLLVDDLGAASVHGVDIDPVMLAAARARAGGACQVSKADMSALDLPDGSFDAVADFGALHLVPEWRGAVHEIARVLRPGGRLFYEEIACRPARVVLPISTGHRIPGGFAMTALHRSLVDAGLTLSGWTRPWHLVPTAMIGDLIGVAAK